MKVGEGGVRVVDGALEGDMGEAVIKLSSQGRKIMETEEKEGNEREEKV